jgi:hypothetical protein
MGHHFCIIGRFRFVLFWNIGIHHQLRFGHLANIKSFGLLQLLNGCVIAGIRHATSLINFSVLTDLLTPHHE